MTGALAEKTGESSPGRPNRWRSWLARAGDLLIVAGLLPVAVWFFSLLGSRYYLAELVVNFRLQLFLALLPVPVLLWWLRRLPFAVIYGAVAVACAIPVVGVWLGGDRVPPEAKTWRVMSFNVLASNAQFEAVIDEIRRHDPDVLVVLELSNDWVTVLDGLKHDYPWSVVEPRWHGYGIGLYSKRPLLDHRVRQLTLRGTDNPCIDARIDFGGTAVQILAAHFSSPGTQLRLRLRNEQMIELASHIDAAGPCLLAGDLNCTPFSTQFRQLLKATGLRDSRQGFGYHGTFPAGQPLVRIPIDHVLVSPAVLVAGRHLGAPCGSDHRPVICDFALSGPAPGE